MAKKSDIQIIKETEANARNHGFNWKCINPRAGKNGYINLVIMKCLDTGLISKPTSEGNIKKGNNMFRKKGRSDEQIIKETEANARKHGFNWKCINPRAGKDSRNCNFVIMKCLKTNVISKPTSEGIIKKGFNIFGRSDDVIKNRINKFGIQASEPFFCSNPRAGKNNRGCNLVEIQCIRTKEKKIVLENNALKFYYFSETQQKIEVGIIQPMYERLLKKNKIDYIKEFRLGKKRIDFMFILNGKKYGLEVKQSNKKYYSGKNQIETYRRLANLSQYKIDKIILSDPKGKHSDKGSLSLAQFERFISK